MKPIKSYTQLLLSAACLSLFCLTSSQAWAVQLSVESKTGKAGDRVQIAVRTDNTSGLGIISVQFVLTFDGTILTARSASTAGTIASSWSVIANPQPGRISISMASATALSGSGNLVIVEFEVSSSATGGQTTQLTITQLQLNEGSVPATALPGTFTVEGSAGGDVTLTVGSANNIQPGATVTIPVSISDVTSKGIISMQMDLDFNSSFLTATNVTNTGAITVSWTLTPNIQSGKVRISMASSTPLSGSGTIFSVTFTVSPSANGQTIPLSFSQVSLNEGSVQATVVNGAINVVVTGEAVQLSFPAITVAAKGASIFVPLSVVKVAGKNIIAASLAVTYTPALATAAEVLLTNGVVSGWTVASNVTSGKIAIAVAGSTPIPSDGELLRIRFDVSSTAVSGSSSPLNIQEVTLNDGNIPFAVQNGVLQVRDNFEIRGAVRYFFTNQGVRNVTLQISGAGSNAQNTAVDGAYSFVNLQGGNYTLTPSKTGDIATGVVSPFDASMILRGAVGAITLTSDQKVAADVDGNNNMQAFDAALILQYVTGIITRFPVGSDWTFVPKSMAYTSLAASLTNQDFKAIVYGDVSGNYAPATSFQKQIEAAIRVSLPDTIVDTTRVNIALQMKGNTNRDVFSFGGKIKFNPKVLAVKNVRTQGTVAASWGNPTVKYDIGQATFAMAGASALEGDGNLLWLEFDCIGTFGDTSGLYLRDFTFNEGTPSAEVHSGFLQVGQKTTVNEASPQIPGSLYLWPNYPNPAYLGVNQDMVTNTSFQILKPEKVSISIYNLSGQLVRRLVDKTFEAGSYQVSWDGRDEAWQEVSAGIYLYRIQVANIIRTRKLTLIR